jgi:hypothetical protein
MVNGVPGNSIRPTPGSWLDRWLQRRRAHPEEFLCAVRVVAGSVPGESARWGYRRSAVDRFRDGDVVTLNHGDTVRLRLRFTGEQLPGGGRLRQYHVVWPAVEVGTGARVEVAADAGEAVRLGIAG